MTPTSPTKVGIVKMGTIVCKITNLVPPNPSGPQPTTTPQNNPESPSTKRKTVRFGEAPSEVSAAPKFPTLGKAAAAA